MEEYFDEFDDSEKNIEGKLEGVSGEFDSSKKKAEEMLGDEDKMERFLQRLERKMKVFPLVGEQLSYIPVMASLIRSYVKKEYTDIPIGIIVSVLGALIYFVSPVDLIPDVLPGIGLLDDAAVVGIALIGVKDDVEEYRRWREVNGRNIDDVWDFLIT